MLTVPKNLRVPLSVAAGGSLGAILALTLVASPADAALESVDASAEPAIAIEQPASPAPWVLAGAPGTTERELEPRYEPAPVQSQDTYNDAYIFALTRGVADSTLHPAGKAPLFLFTVPLDLALLPFAAMGGLFG